MSDSSLALESTRRSMQERGLNALIVPHADEHLNEYLPMEAERRRHLTGFSGSAGDLLLTAAEALLFVDSRYHDEAEALLRGGPVRPVKLGQKGALSLQQTLSEMALSRPGFRVGVYAQCLSAAAAGRLRRELETRGAELVPLKESLPDAFWRDRPKPERDRLIEVPLAVAGATSEEKLAAVRAAFHGADLELIAARLDQIAWLTNLRSAVEIPFNPVFHAFARVNAKEAFLYMDDAENRLPRGFSKAHPEFTLRPYQAFFEDLGSLERVAHIDPEQVNWAIALSIPASGPGLREGLSPIDHLKACKNAGELSAMRRANFRASLGKTRALLWLRRKVRAGEVVTEASFAAELEAQYRALENFHGLSFRTISAAGANAANPHYSKVDDTELKRGELFLIDSGAHLDGGTTDATRTVAIGDCSPEIKTHYTLVLKAHIQAAQQRFPRGTPGSAIDALTRAPLWNAGLDFGHGTGHGVGAWSNVHEGPFSISTGRRASSLEPLPESGVTSIEPGFYRKGAYGIRLENLYAIVPVLTPDERDWLCFESLTWIPFEPRLIDETALTPNERDWLKGYHQGCRERLQTELSCEDVRELERWLAGD